MTTTNKLQPEDMEKWDAFAKDNQRFLQMWKYLCDTKRCPMCKFKSNDRWSWRMFSFHMMSTHGLPEESLISAMK